MRILIVSDNHRQIERFTHLMRKVAPIDMLIHCGDADGSEEAISRAAGCAVEMVSGNNDYVGWGNKRSLPTEREFMLGRHKVWLVHGHRQQVNAGEDRIYQEALSRGADIVMYGHTHRPSVNIRPELSLINPGSLNQPRQEGRRPSYIIMELDGDGAAHYTVNYL